MQWDEDVAKRRRGIPSEIEELVQDLINREREGEYRPPTPDDLALESPAKCVCGFVLWDYAYGGFSTTASRS